MNTRVERVRLSVYSIAAEAALAALVILEIFTQHAGELGLDLQLAFDSVLLLLSYVHGKSE